MVCGGSFVVADCANMAGVERTKSAAPVKTAFITFISSSPCISALFGFGLLRRMRMKHRLAGKVARAEGGCRKPHGGSALQGNRNVPSGLKCASNLCSECVLTMSRYRMQSGIFHAE